MSGRRSHEGEERIEDLKQENSRAKLSFTRVTNKLLRLVDEEDYPSRRQVRELCKQLSEVQEHAMETMSKLSEECCRLKEREKRKKVGEEMEKLKEEFSDANNKAQEYFKCLKDELSSLATGAAENSSRRRIEESIAQKSVEKFQGEGIRRQQEVIG